MNVNLDTKYDILKTLMLEDRTEIRAIKASIYNLLTALTGLSFFVTPFLIKDQPIIPALTDLALILLIWVIFSRLKVDTFHCRQCLEGREDLLNELDESSKAGTFNPFRDCSDRKVKIQDSELLLLPRVATVLVVAKAIVIAVIQTSSK